MQNEYWELFEKTGNIEAYLSYACTSEWSQICEREEGKKSSESGNSNRDCVIGYANGRVR